MSLILNEAAKKIDQSNQDLMSMSDNEPPKSNSAFTRVSHQSMIPVTTSLRDETTPTPASSETSESPPTLRRPPFDIEQDEQDRDDESSNQGDNAFAWPTHNSYDEQRQLLGTEEESSDHATSEEEELMMENFPACEMSKSTPNSKRPVWSITREQINYYTTQFFCLQSDPHGVIPGAEAKEFFERSKLPITDLRKIWQLSDVSQDGCLSLEEFLTAMHLVVLKRNNIDLPENLPPVLRPAYLKDRIAKRAKTIQLKPPNTNPNKDLYTNGSQQKSSPKPENERLINDEVDAKKKLDKSETESIAGDNVSVISSPGRPQPVNFDFHRPESLRRDPNVIKPVAIRRSPDSPILQSSDQDEDEDRNRRKPSRGEVGYEKLWNSGKDDQDDDDDESVKEHKSDTTRLHESGPVSLPASRLINSTSKKDPSPPPPPPRGSNPVYPRSGHARSSSLDLNNLQQVRQPPVPPPRVAGEARMLSIHSLSGMTRDCRALQCKIQEYREKNSVVARTINELHQEVSDALEERIALEYQLEQLKSFGDDE